MPNGSSSSAVIVPLFCSVFESKSTPQLNYYTPSLVGKLLHIKRLSNFELKIGFLRVFDRGVLFISSGS
ncbi:hypothetical protein P8452_37442 [Trifolium repens]|nr:hypothetical protein P8452_37442 [Trifolium repens]